MKKFIIKADKNFLKKDIRAFYNTDYVGYGNEGNPDYINTLKNNFNNEDKSKLVPAQNALERVLQADLPQVLKELQLNMLTVCVVPRAKITYQPDQLLFKTTIRNTISHLTGFCDGTDYIIRHTDTKTTHLKRAKSSNTGPEPYLGITSDTCTISDAVKGHDILVIDDVYTETINIDEDAIQALLNNGAKSVAFYAVGRTIKKYDIF